MVDSNPIPHLALLRGINVGSKNRLPMKELAALFGKVGCINVRTYIQSGNVIFDALPTLAQTIPAFITGEIQGRFCMRIPVILRTAEELIATLRNNPFLATGVDEKLLHVFFLADPPSAQRLEKLDAQRSAPDSLYVNGREIYVHLPNGIARTKFTNSYFDTTLGTTSTARNWRTVRALTELIAGSCSLGGLHSIRGTIAT